MPNFNILLDLHIKTTPHKVFEAIAQPHHLNNWWPLRSSGTPELGGVYNFYFAPEYDWYGEVIVCDPGKAFVINMTDADDDWNPTRFGFQLEAQENGTMLHFSHTDWPADNHHFRRSSFCWAILLKGLKDYVEQGTVIPFEDRA